MKSVPISKNPALTGERPQAVSGEMPIRAFCADFNWDSLGRFASPGLYAGARARDHIRWYEELGINTIQSFCVSHNGCAWYHSKLAPVTPGLAENFLAELCELGHERGMRVMGYWSPGANGWWGMQHPQYSRPHAWNGPHIPLSTPYLDFLCRSIGEALELIPLDGFMIDWLWNVVPVWNEVECTMHRELFGEPPPPVERRTDDHVIAFQRRAMERAWRRIRETAKSKNPDCVVWLSCNDLHHPTLRDSFILREVDWLMNEHPDPRALAELRTRIGNHTRIIQCLCGWGAQHNAEALVGASCRENVGLYGFAMADPVTTLPAPVGENAVNIDVYRRYLNQAPRLAPR